MNNIITDFSQAPPVGRTERPKEMISVLRDGPCTTVRINSSSLSVILTCPRKAQYQLHERWLLRSGAPPLIFGSAMHKALEVFYGHPRRDRTVPQDFPDLADLMAHGHAGPTDHFLYDAIRAFIAAAEPLRGLPDTDKRSIPSGVWVLGHYFRAYANDPYVIHTDLSGPITERTFAVPLLEYGTVRVVLFGTIDMVLRDEVTGTVLPGDHKTASQLGSDFFNRLRPNHQYTGYLIGAQQALGLDTDSFLVNALQVKARPLTARGGPPLFTRQITKRSPDDFAEFRNSVSFAVRNYLEWHESGNFPQGDVNACAQYGACTYLDVCSQPAELRENILEAKFIKEAHGTA